MKNHKRMEECEGDRTCREGAEGSEKSNIETMNTLQNQVQIALTALEMSLDPVIWRTKLRIQELMVIQNTTLRENVFVTHLNHLFVLLIT